MIRREFLNWDRPPLVLASQWLADEAKSVNGDLRDWLIVLPSSQAARRLEARLAFSASRAGWFYYPPKFLTVGILPEQLYVPQRPFADSVVQTLVWAEVLRAASPHQLGQVVGQVPEKGDHQTWSHLGAMLSQLRRELASDQLDCRSVLQRAEEFDGFSEHDRWEVLAKLETDYLSRLDQLGLWDQQSARLEAVRKQECQLSGRILMIGAVDLNMTIRAMLDAVAEHVTAVVFAPPELADRFDEFGCLVSERWDDAELALADGITEIVDGPADQASAVVSGLREILQKEKASNEHPASNPSEKETGVADEFPLAAQDIAIGVPDERMVPFLRRALSAEGIMLRYGPGKPLEQSSLLRMLVGVSDWLTTRRFREFSSLVRHPEVQAFVERQAELTPGWLASLDAVQGNHLLSQMEMPWPAGNSPEEEKALKVARVAYDVVSGWVQPLTETVRGLAQWGPALRELVIAVIGDRELDHEADEDKEWLAALKWFDQRLNGWTQIPQSLKADLDGGEAIEWLCGECQTERVPEPRCDDVIESYGWLELPWDDAPVVIVAGMNEGLIPQSVNSDPFLPNQLRRQLGLEDNGRRFARDFYATQLLVSSRRHVRLIASRRSVDGDPLLPSRLWFRQDADSHLKRIESFVKAGSRRTITSKWLIGTGESRTAPPLPRPLTDEQRRKLRTLRVTQFRAYLACPFRFYLEHVLNLTSEDDSASELEPATLGTLIHNVLRDFGQSDLRASENMEDIAGFLLANLDQQVACRFGDSPRASIVLQRAQLQQRLQQFAVVQAERVRKGWQIVEAEKSGQNWEFETDEGPVSVKGRIDRIDYNPNLKQLAVLDYKTGGTAKKPETAHQQSGEWIDLQLPLYRHLIPRSVLDEFSIDSIELGFIQLPKKIEEIRFTMASWTEDELQQADAVATEVAELILQEKFPISDKPNRYADEFSEICLEGMLV